MSYADIKTLSIQFSNSLVIDELNQCGLIKGASGSLILLMQTYKLCANKELLCKLYKIVDQLIDTWDHNYTLGYGITGLAWTLEILKREGLEFDNINEWSADVEKLIVVEARKMLFVGNFDFFNGASGLVFYLLSKQIISKRGEGIFYDYINLLKYYKNNKSSFFYKDTESELYVKNLGVPHGITGIILIMLLLYDKGYLKEQTDKLIECFVDELISYICQDSRGFQLGSTFCVENSYTSRSVLAWCYGDLMAGYAIYKAGVLLENYEWKSIGVNLLEKSTLRTDIHEDCLALCHGLPSLIVIFNKIYKITNEIRYLQAANKWKFHCEKEIFNEENDRLKKTLQNPSLFQGFPGVLLAFCDDFNVLKECLLL